MGKGSQTIIITSENLRLPKNVTLLDTSPQQVKVTLAAVVEKNLPITPQIIGKLPGGTENKKDHRHPGYRPRHHTGEQRRKGHKRNPDHPDLS
jgi:hypothetical protein